MKCLRVPGVIALACILLLSCNREKTKLPEAGHEITPVEVMAQVDRTTATTGDPIRYTLTAKSDPSIDVTIPEMGSQIAGLRIVDIGETGPIERDGRKIIEQWYELRADIVGSYIIPGAVFSYRDKEGKTHELKTAQIFIEVKSVIDDKEAAKDIKDIKPLTTIPRDYSTLIMFSLAGLVLITLIGGGIYLYRRKYRKAPATPPRPPHELALEELEALKKEDLIKRGIYREHYFKLSEIFRKYLERRFHFQAVEQTSEEILREITNLKEINEDAKVTAQNFLQRTDLVKFANYIPRTNEVEQEHQEAISFIYTTKQEEQINETGKNHTSTPS